MWHNLLHEGCIIDIIISRPEELLPKNKIISMFQILYKYVALKCVVSVHYIIAKRNMTKIGEKTRMDNF